MVGALCNDNRCLSVCLSVCPVPDPKSRMEGIGSPPGRDPGRPPSPPEPGLAGSHALACPPGSLPIFLLPGLTCGIHVNIVWQL